MDLIKIIEEQTVFAFTGKINVLLKENNQYVGAIWQKEGLIVQAQVGQLKGKKALLRIVFDDLELPEHFHFMVEPEVVNLDETSFELSYEAFYRELQRIYNDYQQSKKLRPADHLKLAVSGDFIIDGLELSPEEYDVLCSISDNGQVGALYAQSKLYEFEITNILVQLRKKKAIRVVK